jgi:2-oxoglutarate ferredoxin oxidoreductase subunit beta
MPEIPLPQPANGASPRLVDVSEVSGVSGISGVSGVPGLAGVPVSDVSMTRKDFASDQEVRWCPGCGDYIILAAVQGFLPSLGLRRENIVFVSGIGCSSRFPYYLDTYGMHSIHGRAPAIATGLATARPDLSVWVVTGDGDALSIGGNHLIHAMRRNVNLTILLFNNRIYGLTKGQYSPTSELGKITKSTPAGSVDHPFNPVSLALGAEATFVARTLDSDRNHLTSVLRAAAAHRGTSLVEIYQNCPIFNDGAFDVLKDKDEAEARLVRLEHGKPVRVGDQEWIHDAHAANPSKAFEISRLDNGSMAHVPIGIFRQVERPTYDDQVRSQIAEAREHNGEGDLAGLLAGNDTWSVHQPG